MQFGGNKGTIIHIAGPQGSGKTNMGLKLLEQFHDKIYVKDLDELAFDYNRFGKHDYQSYIDNYINKHNDKPLIFTGLDAELCLGKMEPSDIYYDFHTANKYYINNPIETTLRQRFYRQSTKLCERKESLFNEYLVNPQITQEKLFRFVNLDKWKVNTKQCDELYIKRGYLLDSFDMIYDRVSKLINANIHSQSGGGKCSKCGSPGTNVSTCPLNPDANKPNRSKHPLAW